MRLAPWSGFWLLAVVRPGRSRGRTSTGLSRGWRRRGWPLPPGGVTCKRSRASMRSWLRARRRRSRRCSGFAWPIRWMSSTPPGMSARIPRRRARRRARSGWKAFFDFLKERIASARKYGAAGRDYALFRTLYLAGLRAEEAAMLDRPDVHFGRGPFGKVHVRFGKGAKTSGPRPRWVPMLDGLDLILRWYLDEIRPRMGDGPALFCDEGGGRIHRGTIRNRLAYLLELEQAVAQERGEEGRLARFSPHGLRHACATHNYERGVDLVAIQQMLGHWHVGTTMRYVTPSATFIEDAYRRAVSGALAGLEGDCR